MYGRKGKRNIIYGLVITYKYGTYNHYLQAFIVLCLHNPTNNFYMSVKLSYFFFCSLSLAVMLYEA